MDFLKLFCRFFMRARNNIRKADIFNYFSQTLSSAALSGVFSLHPGEALQCYTCVGSSDDDCNRQGSQQCPGHADACAVIRGQASKCHKQVRLIMFVVKQINNQCWKEKSAQ